jgi:hypothetical protein
MPPPTPPAAATAGVVAAAVGVVAAAAGVVAAVEVAMAVVPSLGGRILVAGGQRSHHC